MKNGSKILELSNMQIFYDDITLFELLKVLITESSIESLYFVPFLSLFCVESVAVFDEQKIDVGIDYTSEFNEKKIRVKLKCFEDKFSKSKKIINNCDLLQDYFFRSKINCNFIKNLNLYYNLGCYIVNGKIIGNTQYGYYIFQDSKLLQTKHIDLHNKQFNVIPEEFKKYGDHCGNIVLKINKICKNIIGKDFTSNVSKFNHIIYYKDFNTNKLFQKDKTIKLYFLHILSNVNYVYYLLRKYEGKDMGWWLKIYYITYYYSIIRIKSVRDYLLREKIAKKNLNSFFATIEKISTEINSKFRNCMMHYKFIDSKTGNILINENYFNYQKPLFGLVESIFDGMAYETFKSKILQNLKTISDELEKILNINLNNSKKLESK